MIYYIIDLVCDLELDISLYRRFHPKDPLWFLLVGRML